MKKKEEGKKEAYEERRRKLSTGIKMRMRIRIKTRVIIARKYGLTFKKINQKCVQSSKIVRCSVHTQV